MILQYFKRKENEYKNIADKIYISILLKSKELIKNGFFKEVSFDTSFELISIILIFYLNLLKEAKKSKFKKINNQLIKNFIQDLDVSMRESGVGDMSIGKYVKKYVKKFYYRIKLIDPILVDFDEKMFTDYLNSLKFTDEKYTKIIIIEFNEIYQQIKLDINNYL